MTDVGEGAGDSVEYRYQRIRRSAADLQVAIEKPRCYFSQVRLKFYEVGGIVSTETEMLYSVGKYNSLTHSHTPTHI